LGLPHNGEVVSWACLTMEKWYLRYNIAVDSSIVMVKMVPSPRNEFVDKINNLPIEPILPSPSLLKNLDHPWN